MSLQKPVWLIDSASIVGKKKGRAAGIYFDLVGEDDMFGAQTWEDGRAPLQKEALAPPCGKQAGGRRRYVTCLQGSAGTGEIATSFGLVNYESSVRPLRSLSPAAFPLTLASMIISGGFADKAACVTSSHFASAEKSSVFLLPTATSALFSATWTSDG